MAIIDLTPYFNFILDWIVYVFNFCRTVLVFQIGGIEFNVFTLSIGIWIFYRSMAAIFGEDEEINDDY